MRKSIFAATLAVAIAFALMAASPAVAGAVFKKDRDSDESKPTVVRTPDRQTTRTPEPVRYGPAPVAQGKPNPGRTMSDRKIDAVPDKQPVGFGLTPVERDKPSPRGTMSGRRIDAVPNREPVGSGLAPIERDKPKPDRTMSDRKIDAVPDKQPIGFGLTPMERDKPKSARTMSDRRIDAVPDKQPIGFGLTPMERDKPESGRTMSDRRIDAVPTNRRDEDFQNYDARRGWEMIRRAKSGDDSKFARTGERGSQRLEPLWSPPRRSSNCYYYDSVRWLTTFPCSFGYWSFGYYPEWSVPSLYVHYGHLPFLTRTRVIFVTRPVVVIVERPIVVRTGYQDYDGYYLSARATDPLDVALSDIRDAWVYRDPDQLLKHVRSGSKIDVLLDGDYAYTVSSGDYRDMTRDAIRTTDTTDFAFDSVRSRGSDRVIAYARHSFEGRTGGVSTVYVSYELERSGSRWYITEVGSSAKRVWR